jgi:hypothetical protein
LRNRLTTMGCAGFGGRKRWLYNMLFSPLS